MIDNRKFSYLEMEAALCVWEAINDWTLIHSPDKRDDWIALRESEGAAALRHASIALGQWCLSVYDVIAASPNGKWIFDTLNYDWDFIPAALSCARDSGGAITLDPAALPSPLDGAQQTLNRLAKDDWFAHARWAANHLWGYPELVADHPERFAACMESGQSPYDAAREIGEHYDLATPDPITKQSLPVYDHDSFDPVFYTLEA